MNLRRFELLLFVGLGVAALAILLLTSKEREDVDRYTGRRVSTAAALLQEARKTGSADPARRLIEERRDDVRDQEALAPALATLNAELSAEGAPPPEGHPAFDDIDAELGRRRAALKAIDGMLADRLPASEVASLLGEIAADEAIAKATYAFFAAAETLADAPAGAPDAAAFALLARLQSEKREPSAAEARAIAVRQLQAGRSRSWFRWLRRAFVAEPTDVRNVQPLAAALVAVERQKEALLVVSAREAPADVEILRLRAQLATWIGKLSVEAEALIALLEVEEDAVKRERLIAVLQALGRFEDAVVHAKRRATADPSRANQDRAVRMALEAGRLDEALALLEKLAETGDKRHWREQIVRIALNDLRYDRAIATLEQLVQEFPDGRFSDDTKLTYVLQLEWLYRLRQDDVKLLDLLRERLKRAQTPDERRAIEDDIVFLSERANRPDEGRAILARRLAELPDVAAFVRNFWDFERAKTPGFLQRGMELLDRPDVKTDTMRVAYELIAPRLDVAGRRLLLERLLLRHPEDAELETKYMLLLDAIDPVASAARLEARVAKRPDDPALTSLWVQRASWIEDLEQQIRARKALRALVPDDLNNIRTLGDLYEGVGRTQDALDVWRFLWTRPGADSSVEARYLRALLAAGENDEALKIARRRAGAANASMDDETALLEALLALELWDEALPIARKRALRADAEDAARERYIDVLLAAERYDEALPLLRARAEREDADEADAERYLDVLLAAEEYETALPLLRARRTRSDEDERRLLDVLQALERKDEVLELMRARAQSEDATLDDRIGYAEALLATERQLAARTAYEGLLQDEPDDVRVLLRVVQLHSWTDAPEGVLEPGRHLLGLPYDEESAAERRIRAQVSMLVGEALVSLDREAEARNDFRRTVLLYERSGPLSANDRVLYAKALARLGRIDSARTAFEALIEEFPEDLPLRLDFAGAYLGAGRVHDARRTLEAARHLADGDTRFLNLDGTIAINERRFEYAVAPLKTVLRRDGPKPGVLADLGWAYRQSGWWRPAIHSWCRSLRLRWNDDRAREIDDLLYMLGPYGKTWARRSFAGDDNTTRVGALARVPLADERWSVAAQAEWARFRGPAEAVGGTVADDVGIVGLSVRRRFGRRHHVEGGSMFYVDRRVGPEVAPWAALRFENGDPFAYVQLEGYLDRLLVDPAAAVALGGRRSGISIEGWRDIGPHWFVSGSFAYERRTIELPAGGEPEDGFASWRASVGRRLRCGHCEVLARLDYTGSRLFDDKALARSIPLGERFDYMTGALALQRRIGQRWDAQLEAYAGADLGGPDLLGGVEGALRLRLRPGIRLRFAAGYGSQARFQDGDSGHVDIELELYR